VSVEVALAGKRLVARLAFVRTFPCMRSHVQLENSSRGK
jgi:hypothetical protein